MEEIMKKLLTVTLTIASLLLLSGCKKDELSYDTFKEHSVTTHEEAETFDEDVYFIYYYNDNCEDCDFVKEGILSFFNNNDYIPFKLVNTNEVEDTSTLLDSITNEPTMLLIQDGIIKEQYIGKELIEFFVSRYGTVDMTDYKHFVENTVYSHNQIENRDDKRYIAYFYTDECGFCQEVKPELLSFFKDFDAMPFYMIDLAEAPDSSSIESLTGTPTLLVISDRTIVESYVGIDNIRAFIASYQELDYDNFESQHIYTYEDALAIEEDSYIIYYYLEGCPHCQAAKEDFLKWAMTRGINEIYFMNGATIQQADIIPTELIALNSGTPILLVMTNGNFADEFYSGTQDVLDYIEQIGDGEITITHYNP